MTEYMIDHVMDYMENEKDVSISNSDEYGIMRLGVDMFLRENGIDADESRTYFVRYVEKALGKIDPEDMKQYFICYAEISQVKNIAINFALTGDIEPHCVDELYHAMNILFRRGLGMKYVPADQVKLILGMNA